MGDYEEHWEYKVSVALWKYLSPCLMVVGLVGNVLAIIVLSRPSMKRTTTSLYLRFLAAFDSLVLYTGLMRQWFMHLLDYDIREHNSVACKIHTWVVYWATYTSAWLLVSVTLERCVSVWFPHKVKLIFTKRKTYIIIVTVIVFMAGLSAHYLFGRGFIIKTEDNETIVDLCDNISENYNYFDLEIWSWVDYSIYSVIPSFILAVCNISIIYRVVSISRHGLQNENENTIQNRSVSSRKSQASSLTAMLLITSTTYVICTTPFCMFVIFTNVYIQQLPTDVDELVWASVNMIQYINNCVNFILYCASGRRFRDELRNLCFRHKRRRPEIYSIRTKNTTL
ncbi:growth hormone secretagogue receptor type 1-like [Gigantopelta aegis]|uniref:growth hormone secretagogue receptor type 1-like n=1 Tax=Gigantopelta aegis TaxID=1735272 RepID=UPI001B88BB0F|nr:growth hormone secretagogue receptor type 1-like [Gigantopelta aegis]